MHRIKRVVNDKNQRREGDLSLLKLSHNPQLSKNNKKLCLVQ